MNNNLPAKNRGTFLNVSSRYLPRFTIMISLVSVVIATTACSEPAHSTTDYSQHGEFTATSTSTDNPDTFKPTEKVTNKPTEIITNTDTDKPIEKTTGKPTEVNGYRDVFTTVHLYPDDTTEKFTHLPMDFEQISSIVPLGEADSVAGESTAAKAGGAGAHVLPTDHITVFSGQKGDSHTYQVYAVADSYLVQVDYETGRWASPDGTPNQLDDYALTFQVSKSLFIMETHLTSIDPQLKTQIGALKTGDQNFVQIKVSAGELLGQGGGTAYLNSNDLWAVDMSKPAAFIHPDWYGSKSGYAVNALDYFIEPLRGQLMNKLPLRPEPRGGQFAFDIDGKLIGSWFPFTGNTDITKPPQQRANLSFFYRAENPAIIEIGYDETGTVYVIKGNSPDPATISVQSGLVKYELMNNRSQDPGNATYFKTEATILVQIVDSRTIKMELFEGKTADEVSVFDSSAIQLYR